MIINVTILVNPIIKVPLEIRPFSTKVTLSQCRLQNLAHFIPGQINESKVLTDEVHSYLAANYNHWLM